MTLRSLATMRVGAKLRRRITRLGPVGSQFGQDALENPERLFIGCLVLEFGKDFQVGRGSGGWRRGWRRDTVVERPVFPDQRFTLRVFEVQDCFFLGIAELEDGKRNSHAAVYARPERYDAY